MTVAASDAGASGQRGGMLMGALRLLGYTKVLNLGGGFTAWRAAGMAAEGIVDWTAVWKDYLTNLPADYYTIKADVLNGQIAAGNAPFLLDVREPDELNFAKLTDSRLDVTPMSQLARQGTKVLSEAAQSKDATIYVMCHHGNRSAQVTAWLAQQGWKNVFNVRGGIDEYARKIDHSIGFY